MIVERFLCATKWYEPLHDKTNKMRVRPAKTRISLGIHPVWSESSLCAQWVAKDSSFLHADSEDSDQTGRMPRLIWVFTWHTDILLVLSWGSSYVNWKALTTWHIFVFLYSSCNEKQNKTYMRLHCLTLTLWLSRIIHMYRAVCA